MGVFVRRAEEERPAHRRHLASVSLQSKGDSEDDGSEDSNRAAAEVPPFAVPKEAPPLRAVPPNLDLEFSTAQESEDEGNVEEVNVVVDSPRRSSLPRGAPTSGKEAEVPSEKTAEASSSPEKSTSSSGEKKWRRRLQQFVG